MLCLSIRGGVSEYSFKAYGEAGGPNHDLLQFLYAERLKYDAMHKPGMAWKYYCAARSINELTFKIERHHAVNSLKGMKGVDQEVAQKILHFLGAKGKAAIKLTNDVELIRPEEEQKRIILEDLQKINGIGPIKAEILYRKGIRSKEEILTDETAVHVLPKQIQQQIQAGRDYGSDVTRVQADNFMRELQKAIPGEFEAILVGDFRRNLPQSQGINMLLFHPSYNEIPVTTSRITAWAYQLPPESMPHPAPPTFLDDSVLAPLREKGLIASTTYGNSTRWGGMIKTWEDGEVLRKADFYLMPECSKPAALLAYTGDETFYQLSRSLAKRRGYLLNEFGLWRENLIKSVIKPIGEGGTEVSNESEETEEGVSDEQFRVFEERPDDMGFENPAQRIIPYDFIPIAREDLLLDIIGREGWHDPETRTLKDRPIHPMPRDPSWSVAQYPTINISTSRKPTDPALYRIFKQTQRYVRLGIKGSSMPPAENRETSRDFGVSSTRGSRSGPRNRNVPFQSRREPSRSEPYSSKSNGLSSRSTNGRPSRNDIGVSRGNRPNRTVYGGRDVEPFETDKSSRNEKSSFESNHQSSRSENGGPSRNDAGRYWGNWTFEGNQDVATNQSSRSESSLFRTQSSYGMQSSRGKGSSSGLRESGDSRENRSAGPNQGSSTSRDSHERPSFGLNRTITHASFERRWRSSSDKPGGRRRRSPPRREFPKGLK